MCDRFYEGMLEAITVTAKLEEIMGLNLRTGNNEIEKTPTVFPQDSNLIPQRWLDNRQPYKTSQEFIAAHMNQGSNNMVRRAFNIMIIAFSGVLIGGAIAVLIAIIAG